MLSAILHKSVPYHNIFKCKAALGSFTGNTSFSNIVYKTCERTVCCFNCSTQNSHDYHRGQLSQFLQPQKILLKKQPCYSHMKFRSVRSQGLSNTYAYHHYHSMHLPGKLLIAEFHRRPHLILDTLSVRNFADDSTIPKSRVELDQDSKSDESNKNEKTENILREKKEIVLTVPNILTLSRVVLTPFLGYLVLQQSYVWACGVFMFAGLTDLMDGWIARNFKNQMSAFGSFMDPLADKLLVSTLFITLTAVNLLPVPLTILVLARDLSLILGAFYIRFITLPPPKNLGRFFDVTMPTAELKPLLISKINTAVQLSLVVLTLAAPVFSYVDHPALQALWYLTAVTTFSSGVGYMFTKDRFKLIKGNQSKA